MRNQRWDRIAWCQENQIYVQSYGVFADAHCKKITQWASEKAVSPESLILNWNLNCAISPLVTPRNDRDVSAFFANQNLQFSQSEIVAFWKLNHFQNQYSETFVYKKPTE